MKFQDIVDRPCLKCSGILKDMELRYSDEYQLCYYCRNCSSEYVVAPKTQMIHALNVNLEENYHISIWYDSNRTNILVRQKCLTIYSLLDPQIPLKKLKNYIPFL